MNVFIAEPIYRDRVTFGISSGSMIAWFETNAKGEAVGPMPVRAPYAEKALAKAKRLLDRKA